jgi:hypothetical protein
MAVLQGTYYSQILAFTDENDLSIDITGYTFEADFRTSVTSGTTLFTLTSGDGLDISDAVDGELQLALSAERTDMLPAGRVVADIHHLNASPGPVFLCRLSFLVKKSVTR